MKTANPRPAMLAKVHVLAKQVGLEGESYRTYLLCITGKRSCGECDLNELQRFIAAWTLAGVIAASSFRSALYFAGLFE